MLQCHIQCCSAISQLRDTFTLLSHLLASFAFCLPYCDVALALRHFVASPTFGHALAHRLLIAVSGRKRRLPAVVTALSGQRHIPLVQISLFAWSGTKRTLVRAVCRKSLQSPYSSGSNCSGSATFVNSIVHPSCTKLMHSSCK